ncbi:cytochrome P450 [Halobacterium yunchengense]|uniref:cytochrome P450 n=1 Tax=Halobacterium yunchengense TaxID=3108497 RepID=UPI00300A83B1
MSESAERAPLPPGPDGLPVVGSFLRFRRDPFAFYDDLREYGDVVAYRMLGYDMCSVLDPAAVEAVLLDDADAYRKPDLLGDALDDYMTEGVLLTEGDQWRAQRSTLQPMFYRERVEAYGDLMAAYARDAAADWADGGDVDLQAAASEYTLRVLARTLLDADLGEHADAVRGFADAVREIGRAGSLAAQLPRWVPLPSRRRHRRAFERFDGVVADLVEDRRDGRPTDGGGPADLLSLLLAAEYPDGSTPSRTEVRDQLMTFLFAGHDTTSLALTWAFVLLNRRPAAYDRLRAEVDATVDGDRATVADLERLPYTDRVAKEVLRLRPPAGALFREPREDVELAGYRVPEGTMVVLPQFAVHTDPRFYDDPETFRPERWTDGLEDDLPDYAYFPFGGGPRHCIGMRFAALELRLALATLVANVDVDVRDPDVDPALGSPFEPADDVRAVVTER